MLLLLFVDFGMLPWLLRVRVPPIFFNFSLDPVAVFLEELQERHLVVTVARDYNDTK